MARCGGANPAASYVMTGTFTLEGDSVCFHVDGAPAPGAPSCVPIEFDVAPGTVWELREPVHEIHMIVPGRRLDQLGAEVVPEP